MIRYLLALLLLLCAAPLTWAQNAVPGDCPVSDGYHLHTSQADAYTHAAACVALDTNSNLTGHTVVLYDPGAPQEPAWREKTVRVDNGAILWSGRHGFPRAQKCVAPEVYTPATGTCELPCPDREDVDFLGWNLDPFDTVCHAGCEFEQVIGGGQSANGDTCDGQPTCSSGETLISVDGAPSQVCRPDDTDEDGTPDNDDQFPNDPNESTDTDGDGIGDNGDHKPDDPTNGKDEDEEGGDEGDNVSTGGGDCNTPPNSSGDGILTQIAFQAWKTRCAIERAQAGDGTLKVSGTGTGGAIAVAGGGGGTDLSMGEATPEDLGNPANGGEHPSVDSLFSTGDLAAQIAAGGDDSGIAGMPRVCPLLVLPSLEFTFGAIVLPWETICDALAILAAMILLAGHIQWAFIVGKIGT